MTASEWEALAALVTMFTVLAATAILFTPSGKLASWAIAVWVVLRRMIERPADWARTLTRWAGMAAPAEPERALVADQKVIDDLEPMLSDPIVDLVDRARKAEETRHRGFTIVDLPSVDRAEQARKPYVGPPYDRCHSIALGTGDEVTVIRTGRCGHSDDQIEAETR